MFCHQPNRKIRERVSHTYKNVFVRFHTLIRIAQPNRKIRERFSHPYKGVRVFRSLSALRLLNTSTRERFSHPYKNVSFEGLRSFEFFTRTSSLSKGVFGVRRTRLSIMV